MPSQITNYQCPACTGPLHFDSASGKLVCDYCGSTYTVAEVEEYYREKDEQAAQAMVQEEEAAAQEAAASAQTGTAAAEMTASDTAAGESVAEEHEAEQENPWDADGITSDWGAEAAGMKAYHCPSCGAELICEETTAATQCPYCNNPSIIPGQFAGTLKPDYIIPFKLDQAAAENALRTLYKGKRLLPSAFTRESHIREIKGIYVPFWLFDGEAAGSVHFHATRTHTYTRGDTETTETEHFQVERGGRMAFSRVPADGAKKMPDGHMDAIEPFHYEDLKEFSTAYLPGYLADKYDVSAKENIPRIEKRVRSTFVQQIEQTVTGYGSCNVIRENVQIHRGKVSYALLPVWILNTHWDGKDFLFAMNGQTGKIVGDLPVSKGKMAAWFFGLAGGITVVLSLLLNLLF